MINTLKMSLKIDMTYAINAFIYSLKRLPVLRDLFTDEIYKSQSLKEVLRILALILSTGRMILFRLLYFGVILLFSSTISKENSAGTFIHIYFVFAIIGLFINNKILVANSKKYFSILLFHMDAKKFMKANLCWDIFLSFLLNSLCFFIFSFFIPISFPMMVTLIFFSSFCRLVGEALNLLFYKKFGYVWYDNLTFYFIIVGVLLGCCCLPFLSLSISSNLTILITIILGLLSIFAFLYLNQVDDYKLIYQQLNTKKSILNSNQSKAYSRQAMVAIKDKDKVIQSKKIQGKKGYDLFNTIFFERHKEILLRSAKTYTIVIFVLVAVLFGVALFSSEMHHNLNQIFLKRMGWFVLIMYFINRGAIVTQAMFYNCDHAMLSYNFYREPKVLLSLFRKRLTTIIKVNLLPAGMIAIGIVALLWISGGTTLINYISIPIFILILSVFFSVHYLVIYYLLQPYNKDMEMKKVSYSLVSMITYIVTYSMHNWTISSTIFSIVGIIFTIIYIVLALIIVYKKAPSTFRIN